MTTVFALGMILDGRPWFLGRAASFGNMMRTIDPATARTWPTVAECESWVDALPPGAKIQLEGRELLILPLWITVGEPAHTLTVEVTTPETNDAPAEHTVERRPVKTAKPTPLLT